MRKASKKNKKIFVIVIICVVVAAGAVGGFFLWQNSHDQVFEDDTIEIIDSAENNDSIAPINSSSNNEKNVYVSTNPDAPVVQPTITFAREASSKISVGSFFDQPASGECKLTLSKPGEEDIIKTTPIVIEAQYICQFWDIVVPNSDGWTAKLTNVNGSSESKPDTRAVEVL